MYEAADVNEAVLTAAEKGVLTLVSQSMTNREIASSLKISAATVKRHLENILRKPGVHNRFDFAARKTHPRSSNISPLRLKAEPGEMLREHKAVVAALNKLVSAAKRKNCLSSHALPKS